MSLTSKIILVCKKSFEITTFYFIKLLAKMLKISQITKTPATDVFPKLLIFDQAKFFFLMGIF